VALWMFCSGKFGNDFTAVTIKQVIVIFGDYYSDC
jgi:hypothetical protein